MLLPILYIAGIFAVVLGLLHFTFPKKFGYMDALPVEGPDVPQFQLLFYKYDMKRTDLRGIIYVMNHCVSYTITAIGIFDLFCARWVGTFSGSLTAFVIAGFWILRAGTQFYLGRRKGDRFVIAFFTLLGLLHIAAAVTCCV